jgi:hypothetical protein
MMFAPKPILSWLFLRQEFPLQRRLPRIVSGLARLQPMRAEPSTRSVISEQFLLFSGDFSVVNRSSYNWARSVLAFAWGNARALKRTPVIVGRLSDATTLAPVSDGHIGPKCVKAPESEFRPAKTEHTGKKMEESHRTRILGWLFAACLLCGLAFLGWFSFHLASIRILQVDECGNVFVAKHVAAHEAAKLGGSIDLYQCILSLFARGASRSIDLFINARFFMLEVFWLNTVLIVVATGEKLLSLRGLLALTAAATLAPFWDYGFEARHDNLVLTAVLLTWCSLRRGRPGMQSYATAGALLVFSQFLASKSFVYTVPIVTLSLMCAPPEATRRRWQLLVALAVGALAAGVMLVLTYRSLGLLGGFLEGGRKMAALAGSTHRLAPWIALGRLPAQIPLLLALSCAALVVSVSEFLRSARKYLVWESSFPEACLALLALTALFINPTPYPYNLLHLVPYLFLFAWRWCAAQVPFIPWTPQTIAACLSVFLFTHVVPFALATRRHVARLNFRQEKLMTLAEGMTDPVKDPVYDAIGMVPTRPMVNRLAFLHGLFIHTFLDEKGLRWRDLLAANPPAVLMPSYRTDWLGEEDHQFITNHYVPLADDFWVLGKVLPAAGGSFQVIHPGRYRISTLKGSDLADSYPLGLNGMLAPEDPGAMVGSIDGQPVSAAPVLLEPGIHRIECAQDCQPAVVWVGPHLNRIHRIGPGDHKQLFVNWY